MGIQPVSTNVPAPIHPYHRIGHRSSQARSPAAPQPPSDFITALASANLGVKQQTDSLQSNENTRGHKMLHLSNFSL